MSTEMPKGITRGYAKSFKDMLVATAAKALTIKDLERLDDVECYQEIAKAELGRRIEAEVNAQGRASNPKWDHPVFGYEAFSEDQKTYLREQARDRLRP
jgi:hypothetical protein